MSQNCNILRGRACVHFPRIPAASIRSPKVQATRRNSCPRADLEPAMQKDGKVSPEKPFLLLSAGVREGKSSTRPTVPIQYWLCGVWSWVSCSSPSSCPDHSLEPQLRALPSTFSSGTLCLSLLFCPNSKFPAKDRCSTPCTCSSHELGSALRGLAAP